MPSRYMNASILAGLVIFRGRKEDEYGTECLKPDVPSDKVMSVRRA